MAAGGVLINGSAQGSKWRDYDLGLEQGSTACSHTGSRDVKVLTRGDCKWTRSNASRQRASFVHIDHDGAVTSEELKGHK